MLILLSAKDEDLYQYAIPKLLDNHECNSNKGKSNIACTSLTTKTVALWKTKKSPTINFMCSMESVRNETTRVIFVQPKDHSFAPVQVVFTHK